VTATDATHRQTEVKAHTHKGVGDLAMALAATKENYACIVVFSIYLDIDSKMAKGTL
jgi:hypothetical protein